MAKRKILHVIVWTLLLANEAVAQSSLFNDGDRVCFIGNSITMNGRYHNYIQLYYVTRFPDRKIQFFNCGISGDDSGGILERMESDILIHKPTWTVLMVGMNDVRRSLYSKEREAEPGIKEKRQDALNIYFRNVDSIVSILVNANCKVVLQTPSIYDQTAVLKTPANVGVNDALGKCAAFIKETAKKYNLFVVDYWTRMNVINARVQQKDPGATIVGRDRVHPDVHGHFVMGNEFLKTQQAPAYVSVISIDARKRKIKMGEQCLLDDIKSSNEGISFTSLEASLPYPLLAKDFDPDSLLAFTNSFNKEIVQISKLKKGNYLLKIDTAFIGNYSAKELKEGINLAKITSTPQYQHSEKILNILYEYWGYVRKLRQIKYVEYQLMDEQMREIPLTNENSRELIEKRMEKFKNQEKAYVDFYQRNFNEYLVNKPMEKELLIKAEETFSKVYEVNKPKKHDYQLALIK